MSKFIVSIFANEKKAYEGVQTLQALDGEGSISLYSFTVVERHPDGTISIKERTYGDAVATTGLGALVGSLIGLVGGPAGAAIGLAAGTLAGGGAAVARGDVTDEFLEDIVGGMQPGNFAVLAEVHEDWTTPLDARMEALGAKVLRETRGQVVDDMIEKRAEVHRAEVQGFKTEMASGKAERTERKVENAVYDAQQRLQRTADKARARLDETKQDLDEKLQKLQEQAAKADPAVKGRIEQRIADMRQDFGERERKLAHALQLAQEALQP